MYVRVIVRNGSLETLERIVTSQAKIFSKNNKFAVYISNSPSLFVLSLHIAVVVAFFLSVGVSSEKRVDRYGNVE